MSSGCSAETSPNVDDNLPEGWKRKISSDGKFYYYNTYKKVSQWKKPTEPAPKFEDDDPNVETVRCTHLLVKHKDSRRPTSWREKEITRTVNEALALILDYRMQVVERKSTLKDLAIIYSDCSSARNYGDIGRFARGQMQKAFENCVFSMKVGELSDPIFTDAGVHLILRTA